MSKKAATQVVGIDISTTAVKVVQVSMVKDRYKLEAYGVESLSSTAMSGFDIADMEEVSIAIVSAMKKAGIKTKHAAVSIRSGAKNIVIKIPETVVSEDEIAALVESEVSQSSGNLTEIRFDFRVLGKSQTEGFQDVLVSVAQNKSVEVYEQLIENAGLKLEIIQVEPNTIETGYDLLRKEFSISAAECTLFFDIGHKNITLWGLKDGLVIYSKFLPFDSGALIQEYSSKYAIPVNEAIESFRTQSIPDEFRQEVIPPFREHFKSHANRLMQYFTSAHPHYSVSRVFISGAAARTPGLTQFLDEQWGIPTSVADLTAGMEKDKLSKIGKSAAEVEYAAPSLFAAIALATSPFEKKTLNLMPWREEIRKEKHAAFAKVLSAVGLASVGLVGLLWFIGASQKEAQSDRNALLESEIAEMDKKVETIQDLDIKRERLLGRKKVIEELQSNRSQIVHLFDQLIRTVPNGIQLSSIKQTGGFLVNEGRSESSSRVSEYMSSLEASPWIEGVDLQIIEEMKNAKAVGNLPKDDSMPYFFRIKMKLINPNNKTEEQMLAEASTPVVEEEVSSEATPSEPVPVKGESLQEVPEQIAPPPSAPPSEPVTEEPAQPVVSEAPSTSPPPGEESVSTANEKEVR